MPITGRTDSHQEGRGIPILARIYKGAARDPNNERKTPAELPYFRVEWQPEAQKYAATFEALYGAQPTQFDGALLMGDTPERAFDNWMEEWGSGAKLIRRCDGTVIRDAFNGATQRTERGVALPCQQNAESPCGCKQVGRLQFILPEFMRQTGTVGVFALATHGWYDIMNIDATVKDVQALYGTLRGVYFTIYRKPVDLAVPYKDKSGEMKRTVKTFHMVLLRVQEGYVNGALSLPAPNDTPPRLIDAGTGEITHPALPAGVQGWSREEVAAWVNATTVKLGLSTTELLRALGVTKFGDWTGTAQEATARAKSWFDQQLAMPE